MLHAVPCRVATSLPPSSAGLCVFLLNLSSTALFFDLLSLSSSLVGTCSISYLFEKAPVGWLSLGEFPSLTMEKDGRESASPPRIPPSPCREGQEQRQAEKMKLPLMSEAHVYKAGHGL